MKTNYFHNFNYSLANEDIRIEKKLSENSQTIAAVCGSGLRALSLIRQDLKELTIFDISQTQLDYARFHLIAIQKLNYLDYLTLFGFKSGSLPVRSKILYSVKPSSPSNAFIDNLDMQSLERGLIYSGRWESFIISIARVVRFFLDFDFYEEAYLGRVDPEKWPKGKLAWLLNTVAHPLVINHFLYRGNMPKNQHEPLPAFLLRGIKDTLFSKEIKSSHLHQLFFLGSLEFDEGIDSIISPLQFETIKNYQGPVSFLKIGIVDALKNINADFWSFSDVLSYLSEKESLEISNLALTSNWKRAVFRTFLKHPELVGNITRSRNVELEKWAAFTDSTRLYQFQIYDKD